MLDISSVYDFDAIDTAKPNIETQADPSQPSFYKRPARFIRIEKAVEIPDKTVRKINASAFGPAGMGMREILGYAPIQPDGSVQIQVPANVPFTIDVLDANARRITASGETQDAATSGQPAGRKLLSKATRRPAARAAASAARKRSRAASLRIDSVIAEK